MVLGRRSFLRSLATAVVGVGIAPKIFLAQTEIIPIEPFGSLVPVAEYTTEYISPEPWGVLYWHASGTTGTYLGIERSSYFSQMKEPHGY
jgi:hypothetical protein